MRVQSRRCRRRALISRAMALETSPESPAPVRQIANAIAGWVDRLGAVWVEGQVAQVSRRPGMNTVFLTLRDAVADISVPVTCSRTLFDGLNPPLVEGASVVVHAKPSYYANRGTLSLYAREIRMVGLGELLARLERRRQLLAAEGLFAAGAQAAAAVPARHASGWSPRPTPPPSATSSRTPAAAGRPSRFEVAYAAMQGPRAARRGDRGGRAARPRPRRRRDRGRPRRRLGRGPAAVLRRGADPGGPRGPHARGLRDRPRARPAAARPGRRRPRLDADRRRQAGRARRRRGAAHASTCARDRIRGAVAGWLAREQAGLDALRSRPALADPRTLRRRPRRRGRPAARPRPPHACATPSTGPPTTSATSAPGPARCRRWPPCSAATPCSRTPTATSSPRSPASPPAPTISVRVADGRIHATTTAPVRPARARWRGEP